MTLILVNDHKMKVTWDFVTFPICNCHILVWVLLFQDIELVGGIPTPLKNMKVKWEYDIPN